MSTAIYKLKATLDPWEPSWFSIVVTGGVVGPYVILYSGCPQYEALGNAFDLTQFTYCDSARENHDHSFDLHTYM